MAHLSARGLAAGYDGRAVVSGVDVDLEPGRVLAIVGPNGAGKSTLLAALAGHLEPLAGTTTVDGRPLAALSPPVRARTVATVASDHDPAAGLTVRELVLEGRYAHRPWWDWGRSETDDLVARAALARTGVAELADRDLATLSSGERQRVWIALALAQDARILLLDEPTSHLDVAHVHGVLAIVRGIAREGRAVALVLHDLNEAAAVADRVALVGAGRVLACDLPERVLEPALLERAYGVAFERVRAGAGFRVFPSDKGIFR